MSMKFCKQCGTLYDPDVSDCPRCTANDLDYIGASDLATDNNMPEEEVRRQRKKNWIQLIIGVPAMIGFFYLVFYLFKIINN